MIGSRVASNHPPDHVNPCYSLAIFKVTYAGRWIYQVGNRYLCPFRVLVLFHSVLSCDDDLNEKTNKLQLKVKSKRVRM